MKQVSVESVGQSETNLLVSKDPKRASSQRRDPNVPHVCRAALNDVKAVRTLT